MNSNMSSCGEYESNKVKEKFNQIKERDAESNSDFYTRNIGQNVMRAGEAVTGLPGGFKKQFIQERNRLMDYFLPEEDVKRFREAEEQQHEKQKKEHPYLDMAFNPPTPGEVRETGTKKAAEALTGDKEYFEPRGEGEKAVGEFTQDLTSFFIPGTGQMRMATRIGAPVLGNLTKQGLKYLGVEDSTAEKAKLGVMLATTLGMQSDPGRFSSARIGQAKEMIPETVTVNALPLANRLMPLFTRLTRGLNVPSKSRAIQGMQELAEQSQTGRINLRSLMDARDHVNEWISEAGGWDVPSNTRASTLNNLNDLKTQIIETVQENLNSRFPEAGELYRTGYEAAAVTHQSNAISNFIERNFGKKTASIGAKLLFPSIATSAPFIPKVAAAGLAAAPIYKLGQVLYRVGKSPTLSTYYGEVIRNAIRGNAPAMIKSLEHLDKELAKDEKKQEKGKKQSLEEFKTKFKKISLHPLSYQEENTIL